MKTFKQLREQTTIRNFLNNLTQAPAPTAAHPASETLYSTMIYGRPGIKMSPPLSYDEANPNQPWHTQYDDDDPDTPWYKQLEVPTADFVKKVTSGEPFRVPELVIGTSRVFQDPTGIRVTPWKRTETGNLDSRNVQKATQGPIKPNRYGIPRNPKVAQEIAAYRSQQPERPTVRYTYYNTPIYTDIGDLRKDFRTLEARKAARDERDQRDAIRNKSLYQTVKARREREAQEKARETQARDLKKATAAQTRFSQMAAKQGADASRRAAEKEIARTTSDLQTSRILGKEIASKLRSQIQTTRDRSEALRQSQADLASARTAAAETAQRQQERDRARQSTIGSQAQNIRDLEATIADMKADRDRLQGQMAQVGSDNDALTRQLEMLNATVANLETRLQQAKGN